MIGIVLNFWDQRTCRCMETHALRGRLNLSALFTEGFHAKKNQCTLNFEVMAVRDMKLRSRLSKNMYLSGDF